ncbi:MAG: hypothetical protein A3J62_01075 [Candidatus Buchananbacteria bacterium RIFCSPHIGHO2_02_FULL_38_8]|uniref:Aminotransferase class I/classII large domain-containing protein n=2 Tax=Candidatus Buchananiibacteriota TaxID=1817903 RepID=A0A1G1XWP7_9BACT|nr:MAG: hypothetical protein A2731_02270 [Candidatus Buchananbacteria bacterium RIFCSPHIGHO2_01_FULL_39_8]OGY47784.1 MAG: hypothetical protein A3J62_01075 [Candidatus Buchananbacteria bacterium RIFCSPHIGHO2_02_FULL_38_8]
MPKISKRANNVIASPIRKFLPLMLQAEKRGIKVFKTNVGDPDIPTPPVILQTIKKYNGKSLGYAPSPGIKEHTEAWIKYYQGLGIKLKPENIVPTVGGAEAILLAMTTVADAGDEIIVFEPLYTSYKGFAAMINIKLVPVTLKVENNFALPSEAEIIKKITKKTKALVLISPNNPTGTAWTKKELDALVKIANKYDLFIISDETYSDIVFEGRPISLLKFTKVKNKVIVVDSVSKKFSCPGARIGCVASFNKEVMWSILKFAMVRLSAPTLEQLGLIPMLKNSKPYTRKITAEYKRRRNVVYSALKKMPGVVCRQPQGAFYIIVKLPVKNAEDFVKFMLTKFQYQGKTIMVTPAEDFYVTKGLGRNEIRIAYVLNTKALKEAMMVLEKGLGAYSGS